MQRFGYLKALYKLFYVVPLPLQLLPVFLFLPPIWRGGREMLVENDYFG